MSIMCGSYPFASRSSLYQRKRATKVAYIRLFIFGLGYSAQAVRRAARARGIEVTATGRAGELAFEDEPGVAVALAGATHVLSSVPPERASGADPVLARYSALLAGQSLLYLSSTGVYGNADGAWVDESAPVGTGRRSARTACDAAWLERGARVFRLPGIYGPGRSVFERIAEGAARRIDLPGQVFSRVHVADIASGVMAGLDAPPGAYNLADDLPGSNNAVIEEACRLLGRPPPPLVALEEAGLSPQARGFYAENRRVANGKARRVLGWGPRYPTFRGGLGALNPRASPPGCDP
jgi:nucleoside-diphosphate-sugar epimerase